MRENTIICHSFPAWDTPYIKSTIELMTRLSKENRVIMVDYHYTWKDFFTHPFAPKKRLLGLKSRWRKIQTSFGEIEVYSSYPVLPTNWINNRHILDLANRINIVFLKKTVRHVTKKVGHHEATLINAFNPVFGLLTKKLWKVKKTLYYCYDEISGATWAAKHGPECEAKYAQLIDGIICTSSHLKEEKSKLNSNCHLIPNGVNLDIFKINKEAKDTNKAIGYVGAIDNRIDFKLLNALATAFPAYKINLYGPIKTEIPPMKENVISHGAIPQEQLPKKINGLDACLIPFVKNQLTKAIYPLKINEYLAMGKPVISTDFADLSDFDKLISISSDEQTFIDQTHKELRYNNRLKAQKRVRFAQNNSWESRTSQFQSLLQKTTITFS